MFGLTTWKSLAQFGLLLFAALRAESAVPTITTPPAAQTVAVGQHATFSVTASGTGPLAYQWKKNNANISGATSASFTTGAVALEDQNSAYTVSVSNSSGSIQSAPAILTVGYIPVITASPQTQKADEGQPLTFSVAYDNGNLPVTLQWFKDGVAIPGAVNQTYTLPSVSASDNGAKIYATVTNAIGSATSDYGLVIDASQIDNSTQNAPPLSFRGGYSDNQCDILDYTKTYHSSSYYYEDIVTVNNCEIPVSNYSAQSTFRSPGTNANWDAMNKAAVEQFPNQGYSRPDEAYWSRLSDATGSTQRFQKYNASDFSVEVVYAYADGNPLPAYPLIADPSAAGQFMDDKMTYAKGAPYSGTNNSPRWFAKVKYGPDPRYFALVHLFPGFTDKDPYNKPLIIGDAFDPGNQRNANSLVMRPDLANLVNSIGNGNHLSPRYSGYDVYFLDFSQGAGDIHINAGLELKFLDWISQQGAKQMIVGGISMSGIIGRLALLYSKPENNQQNVDYGKKVYGFMTVDSPHQGAEINTAVQEFMFDNHNASDINVAINVKNFVTGSDDKNPTLENYQALNTPATYQMLYSHYFSQGEAPSSAHDDFYGFLKSKGNYRNDFPLVGIAYSNFYDHSTIYTVSPLLDPNTPYFSSYINAPIAGLYSILNDVHEYEPGSVTGDVYFNVYKNKAVKMVGSYGVLFTFSELINDLFGGRAPADRILPGRLNGTFIPIRSALDLSDGASAFIGAKPDPASLKAYSPFTKIYYMKNDYNGYCDASSNCGKMDIANGRQSEDSKRYQHIIFDAQVMAAVNSGLNDIERIRNSKRALPAVFSLLQ